MTDSISLGRIAGIPIGANWSMLALLVLLVWTLAAGIFPESTPELGTAAHVAMASIATAVFLASILLHELGHALQARREGMRIEGITLWLFGGVARFGGSFPSAGGEFRIAIAGPAVSAGLGGAFIGLAFVPGLPLSVEAVASWLGIINLVLLAFNMLPALPLDGGRVLRAALWAWRGDLVRATRVAGRLGQLLAYALIVLGAVMFILEGAFSGAWLAFIGWFLAQAARSETRAMVGRARLQRIRVGDVMAQHPVAVPADLLLDRFAATARWAGAATAYPVVADGSVIGLMPVRRLAGVPREEWPRRTVADAMLPLPEAPVLAPDDDLATALDVFQRDPDARRALVMDGPRLVGLLSISALGQAIGSPVSDAAEPPETPAGIGDPAARP